MPKEKEVKCSGCEDGLLASWLSDPQPVEGRILCSMCIKARREDPLHVLNEAIIWLEHYWVETDKELRWVREEFIRLKKKAGE